MKSLKNNFLYFLILIVFLLNFGKKIIRAREEVDRVLGARTEITYQDVNELKYCSSIFKESLRLFPPADALQRETVDEMIINGYNIPPNTNVIVKFFIRLII